jgi:hypothetical protein
MNRYEFLVILFFIGFAVGCIFLGKWVFETIMSSDMPDWLKYMLLK